MRIENCGVIRAGNCREASEVGPCWYFLARRDGYAVSVCGFIVGRPGEPVATQRSSKRLGEP